MKRRLIYILIVAFALLAPASTSVAATSITDLHQMRCKEHSITALTDDVFILVERIAGVTLQLEPDDDGSGVGTEVTLYACTDEDTNTCVALEWDYDNDGANDGSVLDGYSEGQRGHGFTVVRPWIYADVTAYSDDGVLAICPIP